MDWNVLLTVQPFMWLRLHLQAQFTSGEQGPPLLIFTPLGLPALKGVLGPENEGQS